MKRHVNRCSGSVSRLALFLCLGVLATTSSMAQTMTYSSYPGPVLEVSVKRSAYVTLEWQPTGAADYVIEYGTSTTALTKSKTLTPMSEVMPPAKYQLKIGNLTPGLTYYFRAYGRYAKADGELQGGTVMIDRNAKSAYSAIVSAMVPPVTFTPIEPTLTPIVPGKTGNCYPVGPYSGMIYPQELKENEYLASPNGGLKLRYKSNGQLALQPDILFIEWSTGVTSAPGGAAMQQDGNFVTYSNVGQTWEAGTSNHVGAWLGLTDSGNLTIYKADSCIPIKTLHQGRPQLNQAPPPILP